MPILVILLLAAACLPIEWPYPLGVGLAGAAGLTAAVLCLPLAAALVLRGWVVRSLCEDPDRRTHVGARYDAIRRAFFFVNVGVAACAVAVLGWGHAVWESFLVPLDGEELLAPFAELLVPVPYFLIVFGCWLIYFDAERALHRSASAERGVEPFWSRAGYFFHQLRQMMLVVLP